MAYFDFRVGIPKEKPPEEYRTKSVLYQIYDKKCPILGGSGWGQMRECGRPCGEKRDGGAGWLGAGGYYMIIFL